jgi:hypothetical protein
MTTPVVVMLRGTTFSACRFHVTAAFQGQMVRFRLVSAATCFGEELATNNKKRTVLHKQQTK